MKVRSLALAALMRVGHGLLICVCLYLLRRAVRVRFSFPPYRRRGLFHIFFEKVEQAISASPWGFGAAGWQKFSVVSYQLSGRSLQPFRLRRIRLRPERGGGGGCVTSVSARFELGWCTDHDPTCRFARDGSPGVFRYRAWHAPQPSLRDSGGFGPGRLPSDQSLGYSHVPLRGMASAEPACAFLWEGLRRPLRGLGLPETSVTPGCACASREKAVSRQPSTISRNGVGHGMVIVGVRLPVESVGEPFAR